MVWKATEWQLASDGSWTCGCVDDLANNSNVWYHPARILGISPAQFLVLLFTKYKPDNFTYIPEKCLCFWSWKDQNKERMYKNWINAEARKKNYQI